MQRDIDAVIDALQRVYPEIACEQLRVSHPGADDDGIWFFTHPSVHGGVQLESSTGQLPFVLEGDDLDLRETIRTVEHAVDRVAARLGITSQRLK